MTGSSWAKLVSGRDRWTAVTLLAIGALAIGMTSIVVGLWMPFAQEGWRLLGRPALGLGLVILALPLSVAKYAPSSRLMRFVFVIGGYMSLGYGSSALVEQLMSVGASAVGLTSIGRFSAELSIIPFALDVAMILCGTALVVSQLRRLVWRRVARILAFAAVAVVLIGIIPTGAVRMPVIGWVSMLLAAIAAFLTCDAPPSAHSRDLPAGEQQAIVTIVFLLGAVLAGVFLRWELGVAASDHSLEYRLLRAESAASKMLEGPSDEGAGQTAPGFYRQAEEAILDIEKELAPALDSAGGDLRAAIRAVERAAGAPVGSAAETAAREELSASASAVLKVLVAEREAMLVHSESREALVASVGLAAGLLIVCGWLLSVRSMGARARAEEASRAAEIRFRTIFERSPDGVLLVDAGSGLPVEFNDAANETLGYTREEFAAMRFSDHEAEESMTDTVSHFRRILDSGQDQFYSIHKTKLGDRRDVFVMVQRVDIGGRRLLHCLFRDVTDLKAAERGLAESVAELERSNSELEQFAHVASHDLQEPLRKIASFAQLLDRKYRSELDEDADKYLYYIVDGATRMQILIRDLLSYSRITTRAKPPSRVDMGVLVDLVLSDMQIAVTEAEATVEVGELPVISGDSGQLQLVIQNLLGNALKFRGDEPAHVRIGAERMGPMWRFFVTDRGIGFDPRYSEKIFSMFQRLHTRAEYAGTGIGLSVVKKIIERHGGSVSAESEPGVGTSFYFTLPVYIGRWQLQHGSDERTDGE